MEISRRDGESFEQLMRRFKQSMERSGLLRDMKRKRFHLSKGEARRRKAQLAASRLRRRQRRDQAPARRGRTTVRG